MNLDYKLTLTWLLAYLMFAWWKATEFFKDLLWETSGIYRQYVIRKIFEDARKKTTLK